MADQRTYDLANSISTYDGDVYLVADKAGFSRAKQYKMSVLKGHLKVGDQQYTEENYVTNDETLTNSIDQLDMALKALSDVVALFSGVKFIKVSLTSGQVAALGSAKTLLTAPVTSNNAYQIIDIKCAIYSSSALDVGTQDLEIYFDGQSKFVGLVRNATLEASGQDCKGVQVQAEHKVPPNKALLCKLNGDANPSSGTATIDFYIIYKEITLPIIVS